MGRIFSALIQVLCLGVLVCIAEPSRAMTGPEIAISNTSIGQLSQTSLQKPIVAPRLMANGDITATAFIIIVLMTVPILYLAARRTKTAEDFYAARSSIPAWQNGLAIAGDYMSAASLLGGAGFIALYGDSGFLYSMGWLIAYVIVLVIFAGPFRNAGRYTMGDILAFRSSSKSVRAVAAFSTVLVSILYLVAQVVGIGKLMELLLGIPFSYALTGIGCLIIAYVTLGGMMATTWVQIAKAGLLLTGVSILCLLVAARAGFHPIEYFRDIATNPQIQEWTRVHLLKEAAAKSGIDYGRGFLEPRLSAKDVFDQISLGTALVLGTAGMPHIFMRFFTVPSGRAARRSAIIAAFIIGTFFMLATLLGFGSALDVNPLISQNPRGLSNMLLAQLLGNQVFPHLGDTLLAFLCVVAFVTVLALASGLVLASAAAISHDIYVTVIKGGHADQREQMVGSRMASIGVGICAIIIATLTEGQNVALLIVLAFTIASAGNLPTVVLSLFWKKMNAAGIVAGLMVGVSLSAVLVMVSPNVQYPKMIAASNKMVYTALENKQAKGTVLTDSEKAQLTKTKAMYEKNKDGTSILGLSKPLFPLKFPAIVCIPGGFIAAVVFALLFPVKRERP